MGVHQRARDVQLVGEGGGPPRASPACPPSSRRKGTRARARRAAPRRSGRGRGRRPSASRPCSGAGRPPRMRPGGSSSRSTTRGAAPDARMPSREDTKPGAPPPPAAGAPVIEPSELVVVLDAVVAPAATGSSHWRGIAGICAASASACCVRSRYRSRCCSCSTCATPKPQASAAPWRIDCSTRPTTLHRGAAIAATETAAATRCWAGEHEKLDVNRQITSASRSPSG